MKTCTRCLETKPLEEFGTQAKTKDGHRYWCKQCVKWHTPIYGDHSCTRAERDALFEKQGGKCAACGMEAARAKETSNYPFHVDHNHGTGDVRGLLCWRCNCALGMVDDSTERLELLVKYLKRFQN